MPDLGISTMEDVLIDARRIVEATQLPLLVDIDTGWGGAFNIARTVRSFERVGVAAVGRPETLRASARQGSGAERRNGRSREGGRRCENRQGFRVDGAHRRRLGGGIDSAIERAVAYVEAGADIPGAYAQARTLTNTALRLDPDLAEAHLSNAALIINADLDWSGAGPEIRRAIELAPGDPEALFSLSTTQAFSSHVESAVGSIQQALAKNPLSAFWHDWQASCLGALGRFDAAEAAAR